MSAFHFAEHDAKVEEENKALARCYNNMSQFIDPLNYDKDFWAMRDEILEIINRHQEPLNGPEYEVMLFLGLVEPESN